MPTQTNVPTHLTVGVKSGFLSAPKPKTINWQRVAMQHNMTAGAETLVDLGATPMPVEDKGGPVIQDFIERTMPIKPINWALTLFISYNTVKDDQSGGTLLAAARGRDAMSNFQRHINNRVFAVLNAGDGTTYGLAYDGQEFFDSDHKDKGAKYTTDQDNENALALSLDNFETVYVSAQSFKDDQGEELDYMYDLLVVPPALVRTAAQIVGNPQAYDTANREVNPYSDKLDYIVSPKLDTTAWHLIASSERIKPLIVVMREQPGLQHSWFDPTAAEGGRYYFKFFGRYDVVYGYWPLAVQGNT